MNWCVWCESAARGSSGCTAAGAGALSLVLASDGLCMKRDGGYRCVEVRCDWRVRRVSAARGSGGLRDRVCGFMHRDEGAEHRKTGEREQRKTLRSGINARNATQRIGMGQKIPAFGRVGRCWKIWIFIDLTKLRQSFLSVLTI